MLRRNSTKSKSDLHHRKSTSSVRSVPLEHISVAAAQRDAKLAALQAFSRGQDRRAADMALFPPQQTSPYRKENASPVQISRHRSVSSLNSEHNRQILDRKQSVRFVGPDYSLRTSATRISTRSIAPVRDTAIQQRPIQKSRSVQDVDALGRQYGGMQYYQLSDRTSSRGKATPAFRYDYSQTMAADTQCYTPEDDVASQPSSYRRVRKSKSMLTPKYHSRLKYDGHTGRSISSMALSGDTRQTIPPSLWLRPRLSFLHRKNSDLTLSARTVKPRKSIPFAKHRRDHAATSEATQDTTRHTSSNLRKSPLPESSTRSRLLAKPSTLFATRDSKAGQSGKRTLRRGSSNGIPHISDTISTLPLSIHGSMRAKARKASSSIKTRFKNLFVNKSEDDAILPAQQISAQRTHLSITTNSHIESEVSGFGAYPKRSSLGSALFTKRGSLTRIMPRIPSLTAVPSNELLRSRKGSIESFKSITRSLTEDKSRVTSWASTEANTIIAHKLLEYPEDQERQRLSVISENELQAVSTSVDPALACGPASGTQHDDLEPASRRPVVDSQRVYSALMKRMNDTRQIANLVAQQRKLSDNSDPFRTLSPPTSDDSSVARSSPAISHAHACPETSGLSRAASDVGETPYSHSRQRRPLPPPVHLNPKGVDMPPAGPRADRGSAFFGSPTSHLFRTRSPWRRSLQEAIEKDEAPPTNVPIDDASPSAREGSAETDDANIDAASMYSQESQIHKPELHREFPVAGDENNTCRNEESIFSGASRSYRPKKRLISTASSIEWKTRLSHDMAKEGRQSFPPTRVTGRESEVEYVVPTMPKAFSHGHVREEAQIENFDEDEGNTSPSVRLPTKGGTPLGIIEPNVVKLSPQQRSVLQRTPPPVPICHDTAATSPSIASPLNGSVSCQNLRLDNPTEQTFTRVRAEDLGSPRRTGSPTVRLSRKAGARQEYTSASAASTPYFSNAFERQFGTMPQRLSCDIAEKENQSPHVEEMQRTGSPNGKGQIGKSSTIGDVFLDIRRRQRTSGDGAAFI